MARCELQAKQTAKQTLFNRVCLESSRQLSTVDSELINGAYQAISNFDDGKLEYRDGQELEYKFQIKWQ